MKEVRMTIPQFLAYERGEVSLKDIENTNACDTIAKRILNDTRLTKITVFVIASTNFMIKVSAETNALTRIDNAGNVFLEIIQSIGYWLCIIGCIMEILKGLMNGQGKDAGRIMLRYLLIFSALYLMPWAFDLVKDIFA